MQINVPKPNNRFYTAAHSDFQYLAMNNHLCIPDWLPKETVQVSDCNFDPAPLEMLPFTAKKTPFFFFFFFFFFQPNRSAK